ncbi:MAG: FAD-binding oxidoreductase [SAR202 cluster bacterium]|nr:FAD-binding oxidoreductase [SAR202 cluster bacterium]
MPPRLDQKAPRASPVFRLKVAAGLLTGLHGHDFAAARSYLEIKWPGQPRPLQILRFMGWGFRQTFIEIPDALTTVTSAKAVSTTSIWLAATNPLANHPWAKDPEATLPQQVDVVVIGAGFTGAACAYHWSKRKGGTMAVLEMNEASSGSSGRNEGTIVMGRFYAYARHTVLKHLDKFRADLTPEQSGRLASQFAAAYVKAAYKNADMIQQTIKDEGFDVDYARNGWVQGRSVQAQEALDESVRLGREAGFDDWVKIPPKQVLELTGMSLDHSAGFSQRAGSWHPAKWVWSLLGRALEDERISFFSNTRVTDVLTEGDLYEVRTTRGSIRAKYIINATESYTALLHPQFIGRLHPTQTQGGYVEGGPDSMKRDISIQSTEGWFGKHHDGVIFGSDATRISYRGAGRIKPSHFITKYMIAEVQRRFGRSRMNLTREWSCTAGFTDDEFPIVGVMDGRRQYIIAGMCGSGSGVHFNAARHVVDQVLGIPGPDDYPREYFSPTRVLDPRGHKWPEIV